MAPPQLPAPAAVARLPQPVRGPLRFTRASDGVELAYEDVGPRDGTAIVFQHGYTSYRGTWFHVVELLRPRYRCILLDGRGCGHSGRPAAQATYNIAQYAEDVIAVANAAGVHQFVYVGHSMGGGIGVRLALSDHAARLLKLILVAPIPFRGVVDPLKVHDVEIERRATLTFSQWSAYRRSVHARTDYIDMEPDEWAHAIFSDRSISRAYYDGSWESMLTFRADPATVKLPTLMIAGACDNLLGNNLTDFRGLPNASLHVFHRVGHGVPRETPVELAALIDDFAVHGVHTWKTLQANIVLPSKL